MNGFISTHIQWVRDFHREANHFFTLSAGRVRCMLYNPVPLSHRRDGRSPNLRRERENAKKSFRNFGMVYKAGSGSTT